MNMIKNVILSVWSVMFAYSAAASTGDIKGNGGGGVVCRNTNGEITSVTVLDAYEAEFRGIQLDFGTGDTALAIVDQILDRLKRIDPLASESYRQQAHHFFDESNSRFVSGINLPFTEDTGPVAPPVGCKIEQIVFQMQPTVPEDRLFTVNKDLFSRLDAKNQAMLILHEVIYTELSQLYHNNPSDGTPARSHPNSFYVRYYNERIFAKSFPEMSSDEYVLRFAEHPGIKTGYDYISYMDCRRHMVMWKGNKIALCMARAKFINGAARMSRVTAFDTDRDNLFSLGQVSMLFYRPEYAPCIGEGDIGNDCPSLNFTYDESGLLRMIEYKVGLADAKYMVIHWTKESSTRHYASKYGDDQLSGIIQFGAGQSVQRQCYRWSNVEVKWGSKTETRTDKKECIQFNEQGNPVYSDWNGPY